jgi:hypothetical protein
VGIGTFGVLATPIGAKIGPNPLPTERRRGEPSTLAPMRSLRLSLLLLVVGFLGVVAGSITWMVGFVGLTTGTALVSQIAPPVGYGVVGLAWSTAAIRKPSPADA